MNTNIKLIKRFLLIIMIGIALPFCSKADDLEAASLPAVIEPPIIQSGDTLILTANESFFSPVGTLRANLKDKTTGTIYNKYENYDYIYNWKELNDTIAYGIEVKTSGDLTIKLEMGIPESQQGTKVLIYLDKMSKETSLTNTGSENTYKLQDAVTFENVAVGFHQVKLQLKSIEDGSNSVGRLNNVYIAGTGAENAEIVMRRYRANAVHCKWETENTNPVEISVHELTIVSTSQDFYQPITTPFGYTGSAWDKDTQTFGGYNFSLWSYGANDPVPPFDQESHLIAVGPGLTFGAYGHEGTGVKPRGEHPYKDIDTKTQTIAVRKVPGEKYDTYWSYYLDPVDGHWKLYGSGKKFNKSGAISDLHTGAFVEVPGSASKVRSGHEICETQYKGWQMDTEGNWYPINQMIGTTGQNTISFRDWNIVGNKFSMRMGGWGEPGIEKKTLTLENPDPIPDYLKGAFIEELYSMPASFSDLDPKEITNKSAKLNFEVTDLGSNAKAWVFWDTSEGLTKEEKWSNNKQISVAHGLNTVMLENLIANTDYYYRIKILNNEGITWSYDTHIFKTANQ